MLAECLEKIVYRRDISRGDKAEVKTVACIFKAVVRLCEERERERARIPLLFFADFLCSGCVETSPSKPG